MTHNYGRAGGPVPPSDRLKTQHPHGPFAATLSPSIFAGARGAYGDELLLALLQKMPDMDGAHGVIVRHPQHQPVPAHLEIEDKAHLIVPHEARFMIDDKLHVAGVALINPAGELEAFARLLDRGYFKRPNERFFPRYSLRVRKVVHF